jgi:hypothetical protein
MAAGFEEIQKGGTYLGKTGHIISNDLAGETIGMLFKGRLPVLSRISAGQEPASLTTT